MQHQTNNKIKVTFLGTGTSMGVPVITCDCPVCLSQDPHDKRLRTSIMLEIMGNTFVIDCGPDFRIQMLREHVTNLDAVIFTHEHRDHIAGLDDVRAFNYVLNKKIDIYGTPQVIDAIRVEFPYIFAETRYFSAPQLSIHPFDEKPFSIRGIEFIPIQVLHEKLPVTGFRVGDFTYITDASYISDEELEKIKGSRIIVLNSLRNSKHISHFSVGEAVEILTKLEPEAAYLTHLSHFVGLHEQVNLKLPDFIKLAYDGLVVTL
ncbi:MAG: MBL fold metallo-hydrolase [Bacteroidales bacterium]|nr:MBL fold metallo-hydrolase [Bacteroidales bacterium]MDD4603906.1 MBL fold metallo-hydrolase [Bacteroidales bacterium]